MTPPPLPLQISFRLVPALAIALGSGGCALFKHDKAPAAPPPAATPIVTPAAEAPAPPRSLQFASETRVGTVRLVGRAGRFVLVETVHGGMLPLPDGQDLHCRVGGEAGAPPTANLRLSRERRPPFVAADVIDGQPRLGDAVFVGGVTRSVLPPEEAHLAPSLLPAGVGGLLPPLLPPGGR